MQGNTVFLLAKCSLKLRGKACGIAWGIDGRYLTQTAWRQFFIFLGYSTLCILRQFCEAHHNGIKSLVSSPINYILRIMKITFSRINRLYLCLLTVLLAVAMPVGAAVHHMDMSDNNKIILEPHEHESLTQRPMGLSGTSELPLLDLKPAFVKEIDTSSDSVFDGGYDSVSQWAYDFLLAPAEGSKPSGFMAVFKILGLFIVLVILFVIRRLVKLRRLKAEGGSTMSGRQFSSANFK